MLDAISAILTGILCGLAVYIALTIAQKKEAPWKHITWYWLLVTASYILKAFRR